MAQKVDFYHIPIRYRYYHPDLAYTKPMWAGESWIVQTFDIKVKTKPMNERFAEFSIDWYLGLILALVWCTMIMYFLLPIRKPCGLTNRSIVRFGQAFWTSIKVLLGSSTIDRKFRLRLLLFLIMVQSGITIIFAIMINIVQTQLVTLDNIRLVHSLQELWDFKLRPCFEEGRLFRPIFLCRPLN